MLANIPWNFIVIGYIGLAVYILTSLADPSDEGLTSVADVFVHKGKTVLTAAIVTPIVVLALLNYNELNIMSSFFAGYANTSIIRKASEGWLARAKLMGN